MTPTDHFGFLVFVSSKITGQKEELENKREREIHLTEVVNIYNKYGPYFCETISVGGPTRSSGQTR